MMKVDWGPVLSATGSAEAEHAELSIWIADPGLHSAQLTMVLSPGPQVRSVLQRPKLWTPPQYLLRYWV
jgi:hypothetical protein